MAAGLALQASALVWIAPGHGVDVAYWLLVPAVRHGRHRHGAVFAPAANAVLGAVRPEEAGQASGANNAIRELGGVLGVAVLAAVFTGAAASRARRRSSTAWTRRCGSARRCSALGALAALLVPGKRAQPPRVRRARRRAGPRARLHPCPPPRPSSSPAARPASGGRRPSGSPRTGWTVYATARRLESIADLEARGCRTLALDVTDEDSMRAAVERSSAEDGRGRRARQQRRLQPVGRDREGADGRGARAVRDERLRARAADPARAPGMREQGWGKIVNVTSMGGRLTFPGGGYYHATKYAVEAISDALRFEVRGFGIDVDRGRAGAHPDRLRRHGLHGIAAARRRTARTRSSTRRSPSTTEGATSGPLGALGGGPEAVARTIERAITARPPRIRYRVTPSARLLIGRAQC